MSIRQLPIVILPLLFLFGTACDDSKYDRRMGQYHLELMPLPADELPETVEEMTLDPGSGDRPNEVAAGSSLDPNDTQKSLASDGRLGGYALAYRGDEGVVVATRVDLWRDSGKAGRGMTKMVDDFERVQGQQIGDLTITDVSRFQVGALGDESGGVRIRAIAAGEPRYQTSVYFRTGRIVGFATINSGLETDTAARATELARRLEARMKAVLQGSLSVPLTRIAPSVEEVRITTSLELTREERRSGELSQLFEHVNLGSLTDSASVLFSGEDGVVIIDLARFDTEGNAQQVWETLKRAELDSTDVPGQLLEFENLGGRSTGRIFPPTSGNEFVTTCVLVQVGRVVFSVAVASHDPDGLKGKAHILAVRMAGSVDTARLDISGPYH